MLASAVPACASLSVAIHMIHVLPPTGAIPLTDQLLRNAENHSAGALYRCHEALRIDGAGHDYGADEWLSVVHDVAAPLLESARVDREPPSLVQHAQEAVHWLASAVISLDQHSAEAPAALADAIGRLLVVCVFAVAACDHRGQGDE